MQEGVVQGQSAALMAPSVSPAESIYVDGVVSQNNHWLYWHAASVPCSEEECGWSGPQQQLTKHMRRHKAKCQMPGCRKVLKRRGLKYHLAICFFAKRKQKERISAKKGLESYCFNMRTTLDDNKFKDKISEDDKKAINDKCDEALKWLELDAN